MHSLSETKNSPGAFDPAPRDLDEVLSPEWLSTALFGNTATRLLAVRVIETITVAATKVRFEIDTDDAEHPTRSLCVKGFFADGELSPINSRVSRTEARFYRDIAPTSKVRVPTSLYSGVNDTTGHGLVIMHDVIASGGRFLTALEPYSTDQAAASLQQLATLHAESWNGSGAGATPWLTNRLAEFAAGPMALDELQGHLDQKRGDALEPGIRSAERLLRGMRALSSAATAQPQSLIHGDAHAGNIFEIDGRPAIIDWQLLQLNSWALDVAYHLGAVLSVDDRRSSERELLQSYLDALSALGIDAPGWDAAWNAYRSHVVYGYYLWGITRYVAPPIIVEFTTRLGTAVSDLESFELLGV
ncbi:MAG: hypothetical protein JWO98_2179 [Frankiales bacterium]|nr:hypothetical protein [Frankiales bacterium]